MKKSTMCLVFNLLVLTCMAQMPLSHADQEALADATNLATTWNIPLVSTSQVWTTPFFPVDGIINVNGLQIKRSEKLEDSIARFSVYSNNQVVAGGELFENPTFDEARTVLMLQVVNCNMSIRLLVDAYIVKTNNVGDFSLVWAKHDDITNTLIEDPSDISFVRGSKAVRLRNRDGVTVQSIAEILDALLKQPPQ